MPPMEKLMLTGSFLSMLGSASETFTQSPSLHCCYESFWAWLPSHSSPTLRWHWNDFLLYSSVAVQVKNLANIECTPPWKEKKTKPKQQLQKQGRRKKPGWTGLLQHRGSACTSNTNQRGFGKLEVPCNGLGTQGIIECRSFLAHKVILKIYSGCEILDWYFK